MKTVEVPDVSKLTIEISRNPVTGKYFVTSEENNMCSVHNSLDDPRLAILDLVQGWLNRSNQELFDFEQSKLEYGILSE